MFSIKQTKKQLCNMEQNPNVFWLVKVLLIQQMLHILHRAS